MAALRSGDSAAENDTDKIDSLQVWLESFVEDGEENLVPHHRPFFTSVVRPGPSKLGGNGMFAREFLPSGSVLCEVPLSAVLTANATGSVGSRILESFPEVEDYDIVFCALTLLFERRLGSRSPWGRFIDLLPREVPPPPAEEDLRIVSYGDYPARASRDESDVAWRDTSVAACFRRHRTEAETLCAEMLPDVAAALGDVQDHRAREEGRLPWPEGNGSVITVDEVASAMHIVASRAFSGPNGEASLVPWVDFFNDGVAPDGSPVATCTFERELEGGSFVVRSHVDWQQGEEVLISYGVNNRDRLLHHGFALPPETPLADATSIRIQDTQGNWSDEIEIVCDGQGGCNLCVREVAKAHRDGDLTSARRLVENELQWRVEAVREALASARSLDSAFARDAKVVAEGELRILQLALRAVDEDDGSG
jgi:SET domain